MDLKEGEKKKVLFTMDGCGHCDDLKKRDDIKKDLADGNCAEVPCSDNPDSTEFGNYVEAVTNDIEAFPTLVEAEKKDGKIRVCEVNTETMKIKECREYTPLRKDHENKVEGMVAKGEQHPVQDTDGTVGKEGSNDGPGDSKGTGNVQTDDPHPHKEDEE